ncbi:MAG: SulP family inorganic anion transporter [Syntrophobacteraceae bacterium]|nr:SulP family inorganic anion transporter [Syntrophobacteraceae bacterium]
MDIPVQRKAFKASSLLLRVFPFFGWAGSLNPSTVKADFIAGLSVALVLIPQSMAYAQLAGLPPYYGLYASLFPPLLAGLFGSSRQLATGPVAIVSLMTNAALAPLATAGSTAYIAYAILLALIVGLFQLCIGVLRLGMVVNFLSHPVVNGFVNAGAVIIASSQLAKLFGVPVGESAHQYETVYKVIVSAIQYTHWPTLALGIFAFAIMYGLKWIDRRIPNVLVAVVVTVVISWATGFERNAKVGVDAFAVAEVRGLIDDFNADLREMKTLEAKKAALAAEISSAEKAFGSRGQKTFDLKQQALNVAFNREELKEKSGKIGGKLRNYLFSGVAGPKGEPVFYAKGHVPEAMLTDGRTWRIKVKNDPLDPRGLTMSGGGNVVGKIPKGLPSFAIPNMNVKVMLQLFPLAAIICLLGFMEAISIAKGMAAQTGQRLDPNQELIGQGIANIVGSFSLGYPVSGSFSRSAVNLQSGAKTGLSSVFTSICVAIVLLFFTPLLYYLPESVLAAIIMVAVLGLINISGFVHAWKAQWYDGLISIITCVATLITAPDLELGITIGVVLSLMVFLYKSMRPKVTTLSMYPDKSFKSARQHGLKECKHIAMIRFEGQLFYANAGFLEDMIFDLTMNKRELRHIHIVANGINDMDSSGEEILSLVVERVRSAGYDISFSGLNENVMEVLKRTHLYERIGERNIFSTMQAAIQTIHSRSHTRCREDECPLMTVCFIN